ncbi:MAG: serine protease [Sporichthyaceae bacterium]
MSRIGRRSLVPAALALVLASAVPAVGAERTWADAATASIHPGIATLTEGGPCTANFVFVDGSGAVYIGQAAHCSLRMAETDVDGCRSGVKPVGTKVSLGNSGVEGAIAYNSWATMQENGETDENVCRNNDFALIRIPEEAVAKVNPSIPVFGGPRGIVRSEPEFGAKVLSYGNSNLRGGAAPLSPQRGFAIGSGSEGWYHLVYEFPTGIPGDSGAGFLDGTGKALGVLIDFNDVPPASNGVGDLAHALAYAQTNSGIEGLRMVDGTEPFTG